MKKTLIQKFMKIGWTKFLCSILAEILILIFLFQTSEGYDVPSIICGVLFSICCLIYFIQGLSILIKGKRPLREYIKNSGISYENLDKEFRNTTSINNIYIGDSHLFSYSPKELIILPIENIESVYIARFSTGYITRYYYLYLMGKDIKKVTRILGWSKTSLEKAVQILLSKKDSIIVK